MEMILIVWLVIFFFREILRKFHYQRFYILEKSIVIERFSFNQQKERDEGFAMVYFAELQTLSINCAFGDTLNDILRDRLVCGLSSPKIQKVLLGLQELTFVQACDIAVSMELEENAKLISDYLGKYNMLKLKNTRLQVSCYRCGRKHFAS